MDVVTTGAAGGRPAQISAAAHAGFFLTGVVTTLLGPILPAVISAWRIDDEQAGYLFTAQSVGSLAGLAMSAPFLGRLGYAGILVPGFLVMAGGVSALAVSGWPAAVAGAFAYGIGLGVTIPTINLMISDLNAGRRAEALNLLNLVWGLGAVVGPLPIATLARSGLARPLLTVAGLLVCVAAWLATCPRVAVAVPAVPHEGAPRRTWTHPMALVGAALVYVYIGAENGIGGWIASYTGRLEGSPEFAGAGAQSTFWGALLLGRGLAPAVLRRVGAGRMVLVAICVASAGAFLVLAAGRWGVVIVAAAVAGLGLATVFPTTLALLTEYFGEGARRVLSFVFACAGLGAATLPWLVGFISTHTGSLRVGLLVPCVACLVMLALHVRLTALRERG